MILARLIVLVDLFLLCCTIMLHSNEFVLTINILSSQTNSLYRYDALPVVRWNSW